MTVCQRIGVKVDVRVADATARRHTVAFKDSVGHANEMQQSAVY